MGRGGISEVELGLVASDSLGGFVVGSGGFLGGVVGAEPHSHTLVRVPNLRRPFSPRPLPDSSVHVLPNPRSGGTLLFLHPNRFLGILARPCNPRKNEIFFHR